MDKVISYNEFLKHKDNLENYLKDLFDKIPEVTVYFPISLSSDERHLIYTKSKGYLFEKLHKVGSKYSIKLWKPEEVVLEEKSDKEYVPDEDPEDPEDSEEEEEEEEYDFKEHLCEISNMVDKQNEMIMDEIQRCRRSVNRVECLFTFIMMFNMVGSILFLTQVIDVVDLVVPLPRLSVVNDF